MILPIGFVSPGQLGEIDVPAATSILTSSGTAVIDCSLGEVFSAQLLSATTAASFTNVPASGTPCFIILIVAQGYSPAGALTWPAGVKWSGGVAYVPSTTYGAQDTVGLMTADGGTTWYGVANKGFA